jgi:SpoIID/LytB domain protein
VSGARALLPGLALAGAAGIALPVTAASAVAAHHSRPLASRAVGASAALKSIDLVGHGYGPGIGMGQWGAFGDAVRYHLGYEQILDHFYGGTSSTTLAALGRAADPVMRVLVLENMNLATNRGYDPVLTSASAFTLVQGTSTGVGGPGTITPGTTTSTTLPTATSVPATTVPTTTVPTTTTPPTTTTTTSTTSPPPPTTGLLSASPRAQAKGLAGHAIAVGTHAASGAAGIVVPAGQAIDLHLQKDGTWSAFEAGSCGGAKRATTSAAPLATGLVNPVVVPASAAATAPATQLLTICRHDGVDEQVRGAVEAFDRDGYERTINLTDLQSYLDGVVPGEESPSWGLDGGTVGAPSGQAWGFQTLESQAVAARSYAIAYAASGGWDGYADICDSTYCQAYVGAGYESSLTNLAVADTAGEVRTASGTAFVTSTRYSASTGGYTVPGAFPAVADPGDACVVPAAALECNPNHTWRVEVSAASLERHLTGIGAVTGVRVVARDRRGSLGGRADTVVVTGRGGSRQIPGTTFAADVGLRSDWFAVSRLVR